MGIWQLCKVLPVPLRMRTNDNKSKPRCAPVCMKYTSMALYSQAVLAAQHTVPTLPPADAAVACTACQVILSRLVSTQTASQT
jgi:hypothetical protein